MIPALQAVLIDFGGVIADEGFRDGLREIGRRSGLNPEAFFVSVERIIADSGYLTGLADEHAFWDRVRTETGIAGGDDSLRSEILGRFTIRKEMLDSVDWLRSSGLTVAMLSDQTNWLEEIDAATRLFGHFDAVFNSYRIHKSKRDPSVFTDVCGSLGIPPGETLFVDDTIGHIERASDRGLLTLHFTTVADFRERLAGFLG